MLRLAGYGCRYAYGGEAMALWVVTDYSSLDRVGYDLLYREAAGLARLVLVTIRLSDLAVQSV